MIPSHDSEIVGGGKITVHTLGKLNTYDFTEPHRHNYFELFFFEAGGGTHMIDFKDFTIQSNSIQIVAPGQVHQMQRSLDSNGFVFLFDASTLNNSAVEGFLTDHSCYGVEDRAPTYDFNESQGKLMKLMIDEVLNQESLGQHPLLYVTLLGLCVRCMNISEGEQVINPGKYAEFRKQLIHNFKEIKRVNDYADLLNITTKTLNDLVKKKTGKTASDLIYRQLILEANRLLLMGLSAKEVAYELNFDDPAHFSKFYKSKTGISPSEFRNVHGEG